MSSANSGTQAGAAMGTPQFMPPEQARGEWNAVDGRTDLWALGATMYTCVTGLAVREAETPNLALLMAMTAPVKTVREVAPWVPTATAQVIDRALSLDRESRYSSAEAMQRAVRHAARAGTQFDAEPMPAPLSISADALSRRVGFDRSTSRGGGWIAAVVAIGAMLGAAAIAILPSEAARHGTASVAHASTASSLPSADHADPPTLAEPVPSASAMPSANPSAVAAVHAASRSRAQAVPAKSSRPAVVPVAASSSATPAADEVNPLDLRR
jgi:serine/threonine-protein kinase